MKTHKHNSQDRSTRTDIPFYKTNASIRAGLTLALYFTLFGCGVSISLRQSTSPSTSPSSSPSSRPSSMPSTSPSPSPSPSPTATGLSAPSSLSYSVPTPTYTVSAAITSNRPTSSGGAVASYAINPALSSGLNFSTVTGVISGTPTVTKSATNYTVTATNAGGSTNTILSITVQAFPAPSSLNYSSVPGLYVLNTAITNNTPSSSGGAVASYSILPALSAGLNLNLSTGVISGTPTATKAATNYTVTATNAGGSTNKVLSITVLAPPSGLSYSTPSAVYRLGSSIVSNTPSNSGGAASSYSISSALPTGLNFNTTTGVISGTPSATVSATNYTVTATNYAGNTTANVSVTTQIVHQAFVGDGNSGTNLFYCGVSQVDGTLSSCTQISGGSSYPWGVAMATINGTNYVYITDLAYVYLCTINGVSGAVENCNPTGDATWGPERISIATVGSNTYAFIASALINFDSFQYDYTGFRCLVNVANGTLSSCTDIGGGSVNPVHTSLATFSGNTYIYIAGSSGYLGQCSVSSIDGSLSTCNWITQSWTPESVSIATVGSGTYAYVTDNSSSIWKCTVNTSDGTLSNCGVTNGGTSFVTPNDIIIATEGSQQYAYIADQDINNIHHGHMYKCSLSLTDGTLTTCTETNGGQTTWFPQDTFVY